MNYTLFHDSPLGPILLAAEGSALTGLWFQFSRYAPVPARLEDPTPVLAEAGRWLQAYFDGRQPCPRDLPLAPQGTPFQRQVWDLLLAIPYGETRTYLSLARQLSPTMAPQAVGRAVGRNPISLVIPCHRVVGSQGQLTGYAGGLWRKEWLLRQEGALNT